VISIAMMQLPNLRAHPYPAPCPCPCPWEPATAGCLSVDISRHSLFTLTFRPGPGQEPAAACDIDDAEVDEENWIVSFGDANASNAAAASNAAPAPAPARYQLSSRHEAALLRAMLAGCQDVFRLSLRLNTAVRDCFRSGIRSGGGAAAGDGEDPSAVSDALLLETLAGLVSGGLPAARAGAAAAAAGGAAGAGVGDGDGAAGPAATAVVNRSATRTAPKKCFFCQMGAKKYREDQLMAHPYVSCDFRGAPLLMCAKCVSAWKLFRDAAIGDDELMLPGESNEELCALCSSLPETLVLCARCPRSYCAPCLSIVMGQGEFRRMKTQTDWKCMECAVSKKKKGQHVATTAATTATTATTTATTATRTAAAASATGTTTATPDAAAKSNGPSFCSVEGVASKKERGNVVAAASTATATAANGSSVCATNMFSEREKRILERSQAPAVRSGDGDGRRRGRKRKLSDSAADAEAVDRAPPKRSSPSTPPTSAAVAAAATTRAAATRAAARAGAAAAGAAAAGEELDELFYFGQYMDSFGRSFSAFRADATPTPLSQPEESEDNCFLCKDGNYL
jgi:hypothetical protein